MEDWRMREMNGKGSHGKGSAVRLNFRVMQLGCCPALPADCPWTLDLDVSWPQNSTVQQKDPVRQW